MANGIVLLSVLVIGLFGCSKKADSVSAAVPRKDSEAQQERDEKEVHAELERKAKVAEPDALAQKDKLFADAKAEHDRDVTGFHFKCSRWGEWLELSTARMANPAKASYPQRYSTSLNLDLVTAVRLQQGHAQSN